MSPSSPNDALPLPNSSGARILKKKSTRAKLATDYPSFVRQERNPLTKTHSALTKRGEVLKKLGLVEKDLEGITKIHDKIRAGWGSIADAISILESDDSPESIRFISKWNSLTEVEHKNCHIEDIIAAAGLTGRKFIELLAGATIDHDDFVSKIYKSRKKLRVLESTFKAATEETPIVKVATNADGTISSDIVGYEPADVKAMELFFKLTGDIKQGPGVLVNSNNQTANISAPAPERDPLQSMDRFLLEIEEVRKPKQLSAPPVIPVEMPENAPEIEYLDLEG